MFLKIVSATALSILLLISSSFADGQNDYDLTNAKASFDLKNLDSAEARLKALETKFLEELEQGNQTESKTVETSIKIQEPVEDTKAIEVPSTVTTEEPIKTIEVPEINTDQALDSLKTEMARKDSIIEKLSLEKNKYDNIKKSHTSAYKKLQAKYSNLELKLERAEIEIERLSSILENHNRSILGLKPIADSKPKVEAKKDKPALLKTALEKKPELAILTVSVNKANLRTGPGKNHSPLMSVSKNSRLVMEKRQGSWYRVIAPNGVRAWVSSSVVQFGPEMTSSPTRTIKINGYDQETENQAMRMHTRPF